MFQTDWCIPVSPLLSQKRCPKARFSGIVYGVGHPSGFARILMVYRKDATIYSVLFPYRQRFPEKIIMKILKGLFSSANAVLAEVAVFCIRLYQVFLSPDRNMIGWKAPYVGCRYEPSCSEYAIQAVRQYGLLKGSIASCKRILRCHPYAKGGYDPIIKEH